MVTNREGICFFTPERDDLQCLQHMDICPFCLFNLFGLVKCLLVNFCKGY